MKLKYQDAEFDFEVEDILDDVIKDIANRLSEREAIWIKNNLTLNDKTRESVHKRKERTKYLPDYLTEKTKNEIKKMDEEANEIIKEGKIDDVVFYFNKLEKTEKEECLKKLERLL